MGLRNFVMGDYYCAQAHAHSNSSEVDKCNELYKQKNLQDNEANRVKQYLSYMLPRPLVKKKKEVQLARIRAEEKREEQRTLQMKYCAEAARDIRIAQMNANYNNGVTFPTQGPPAGTRPLPSNGPTNTNIYGPQPDYQLTPYMTGNIKNSHPAAYNHPNPQWRPMMPPYIQAPSTLNSGTASGSSYAPSQNFPNSPNPSTAYGHEMHSGSDSYRSSMYQSQRPGSSPGCAGIQPYGLQSSGGMLALPWHNNA